MAYKVYTASQMATLDEVTLFQLDAFEGYILEHVRSQTSLGYEEFYSRFVMRTVEIYPDRKAVMFKASYTMDLDPYVSPLEEFLRG